MNLEQFEASLRSEQIPADLSPCALALWQEKHGNWDAAHRIVQDIDTREAAAIHAYLHRREGDIGNAQYWYRQAGRHADLGLALDDEWLRLVQEML